MHSCNLTLTPKLIGLRKVVFLCIWGNVVPCCLAEKRTLSHQPLMLKGNQLKSVDQYKYLGLIFCSNLCWSEHSNSICNKVRRLIGLLYRRFYEFSDSQSLLKFYRFFICPHKEYASIVWSPYLLKEKAAIEKVQHFALRVCLKDWLLGYDKSLDLTTVIFGST